MSCPICQSLSCPDTSDSNLYSLQSDILGWVLDCPIGYDCQNATTFNMVCCGQLLTGVFPPNATVLEKQGIIQRLIDDCVRRDVFCGTVPIIPGVPPNPPRVPNPPINLFYNRTQTCSVKCPDGNDFTYTVVAGTFAALNQSLADQQAKQWACSRAKLLKFCLTTINTLCCKGTAFTTSVIAQGNVITPCTWQIVSGALPDGLLLGGFSPNIDVTVGDTETIEGTPTVAGTFNFTLRCTGSNGAFTQKQYTMCVAAISPATLPNGKIGTAYSQSFTDTNACLGTVKWSATNIPPGLTLNVTTGLLSGTPTGSPAAYNMLVTETGPKGTCQKHITLTIDAAGYDPTNPPLHIYFTNASFAALNGGCIPGLTQAFTLTSFTPTFVTWSNGAGGFLDWFPPVVPGGNWTISIPTTGTTFLADFDGAGVFADGPFGHYICHGGGSCGFIDVDIVAAP